MTAPSSLRPRLLRAGALLASLAALPALPAFAHAVGVSRGEYRVVALRVEAELVFAEAELRAAFPELDADRNGQLTNAELAGAAPTWRTLASGIEVASAAGTCAARVEAAVLTKGDGLVVRASYTCPGPARSLRLSLLESLSQGHRHLAGVTLHDGQRRAVLFEGQPGMSWGPGAGGADAGAAGPDADALSAAGQDAGGPGVRLAGAAGEGAVAWPLFRLGVEHILTGYDHLLFLLALILVGGRLRSLLLVVTAFTAAHSLTLGLAALGAWAPSPRLVEPAIALSIAYVGVENCFVRDGGRRWLITFPFGLVHGFGFAGALREIDLPAAQLPVALAAFNVGVEAGQVAVLVIALPGVLWLGTRPWFGQLGVRTASAAIAIAGLSWFALRLA